MKSLHLPGCLSESGPYICQHSRFSRVRVAFSVVLLSITAKNIGKASPSYYLAIEPEAASRLSFCQAFNKDGPLPTQQVRSTCSACTCHSLLLWRNQNI